MLAEASTSMRCKLRCMLGTSHQLHAVVTAIVVVDCVLPHPCKPECSCHHRRRSTIGHGLSKGETKRDMRRGVYMHTVRFEPAVPGSSRIPHDPLSHPTCARQIQITRCFPSPPCRRTPPTYTRQPNPAVDGDRLKQSDFCADVLGKGNDTYGESRVARAGGRTVLLHSYQPLARAM